MGHIKKAKLSNGVFWINIPEADLRILCGCPADSVKHMMKSGMIYRNQAEHVFHESGPNAILLSDLTIQKGSFSNLAEFPVLQMLYRQGMILPNHPGNTGVKPLLIGHPDQLDAQIEYIYRGNYGLISKEEMTDTGLSDELAETYMRLKLKFAFGKIVDSQSLLDRLVVEREATPIRNGVSIRRLSVNVFEFLYKDETVRVDLNLADAEYYNPPYRLGHFQVEREYFSVIHSGEGDGWDVERPSMASIITFQGKIFLIDAGPNIETTLNALGIDISEIEGIFMTHCHDDHFAGLPSLIRSDHRLKFFATPLVRSATIKKIAALMGLDQSRFETFFESIPLEEGVWNDIKGLEVKPVFSPHPLETTIMFFRAQWGDDYKTYGHLADIASFEVLEGMLSEDPSEPGLNERFYKEIKENYLSPCDIKKIDCGGGLIHGMAEDFRNDTSGKLIFAHMARSLKESEREFGSGAPFGTQDILIPSNHDMLFGRAYGYLEDYFPDLPSDQFRLLLNHEVVDFNPEEIILRAKETVKYAYFILTGTVEILLPESQKTHRISGGSFIGDIHGLYDTPSAETYRAISFVKALKLPMTLYKEFVKRNDSFASLSRLAEKREILQKTWLFGGSLSDGVKNAIAASMHVLHDMTQFDHYEFVKEYIALVKKGHVSVKLGDSPFTTLREGDSLFEDHAVFQMGSIFNYDFSDDCIIAMIPIASIKNIPVVQWKLLENVNRQIRSLTNSSTWDATLLEWKDEYSVGIDIIDAHHKELLRLTRNLISEIEGPCKKDHLLEISRELADYTDYHFSEEENLFVSEGFSEADLHKRAHQKLMTQVVNLESRFEGLNSDAQKQSVVRFLKRWILLHILIEDRKYASFILKK